jgi:hypothetical protein
MTFDIPTATLAVNSKSVCERPLEEGGEEVLGLAQRLALHGASALVSRQQFRELLVRRKGNNFKM